MAEKTNLPLESMGEEIVSTLTAYKDFFLNSGPLIIGTKVGVKYIFMLIGNNIIHKFNDFRYKDDLERRNFANAKADNGLFSRYQKVSDKAMTKVMKMTNK